MMKELVRCTVTVKDEDLTLAEFVTYGVMVDKTTITTPEYTFHSNRNAGFGKKTVQNKKVNNKWCKVYVKIEK